MKKITLFITALVLALSIAGTPPAQVFADSLPEYISEVKVYEGSYDAAASEGFKILCGDDGNPVDLNRGSGSTSIGAKGNKKVYLGYKTTTLRSSAITDLHAGYTTGIHMFGEGSAFNLNSGLYCWNKTAKSVFVYFKVDTSSSSSASAAGSGFTAGILAVSGIGGLALGALISGLAVSSANKKKRNAQ